jgi:hypothetical protein
MSWGYWGIVAGLAALVGTFFVCIELLYPDAKESRNASSGTTDKPIEAAEQPSARGRYAA